MKQLLITTLALCCVACSTQQSLTETKQPNWPVMAIASDAHPIRALQQITAQFQERTERFQGVIDLQPESLKIILLDNTGQRLASIAYIDGALSSEEAIKLPIKLPLQEILETIQLVFTPKHRLEQHLSHQSRDDWQIHQQGLERQVFYQKNHYATITYNDQNPWSSQSKYKNHKYNYSFIINSILLP